jgi:hydroxyacylglutathione hydrolase
MTLADIEIIDSSAGIVIRRVAVGPLQTNCWIVFDSDTTDAVVIDPGAESQRIIDAASDLHVRHIVLTHAHWDHVLALPAVNDACGVLPSAHPNDAAVWPHEQAFLTRHGHFDAGTATAELLQCGCTLRPDDDVPEWDGQTLALHDRQTIACGSASLTVLATPGHTPGGVSLVVGDHLFSGDTLFPGGPGLTGWPLSDFDTIIDSIATRLFTLPGRTIVHPGHGRDTTITAERPALDDWRRRRW